MIYDKHCLSLSKEEVEANLAAGKPFVIRQNIPNEGTTTFQTNYTETSQWRTQSLTI